MAIIRVSIVLQASYADGRNVPFADFVGALALQPEDGIESHSSDLGEWGVSRVVFPPVCYQDCAGEAEPWEAMNHRLLEALTTVSAFLERRPEAVFEACRQRGLEVKLFLDLGVDQNQMDFSFPPRLIQACARHQLGVEMISNDSTGAVTDNQE